MNTTWAAVDQYFGESFKVQDSILASVLKANEEAGLPSIDVSPNQGQMLYLLAKSIGAKSILEVGTLGGYSAICLARALSTGGRVISLEFSSKHAEVARANIERAGLQDKVEIRVGDAMQTLPQLADQKLNFDLAFIDADKRHNADYFQWALKMSHPGSLIIIDNVVRKGTVIETGSDDIAVLGARRAVEAIQNEPKVEATVVQTVGSKGYDGFILARVR